MSAPHDTATTATRPIFSADPVYGYGERLVRIAETIARLLAAGLPELASVSVGSTLVYLTPWQPGAPLSSLLAWSEHLTGARWEAKVHPPLPPGGQVATSLYVSGRLAGLEVELTGSSWRPIPGIDPDEYTARQRVDPAELARLAALEEAL
jgi:hypothetical protein